MKRIIITLIILIAGLLIYSLYSKNKVIYKTVSIDKIILEKGKRELSIYYNQKLIKTYHVSLGRKPIGPKEKEGDKKTPEGNYIISSTSTTMSQRTLYENMEGWEEARDVLLYL